MKVIKHVLEHEEIQIKALSDLHIGSKYCDLKFVEEQIDEIRTTDNMYTFLNGDLVNMALRDSVSDIYNEVMSPEEQMDLLYDLLLPIKHKILGFTLGNHTARVNKTVGIDLIKTLSRMLGLEHLYKAEGICVFIKYGITKKHTASFYLTHKGTSGGRRAGGTANGVEDLAGITDVDVYIRSHVHRPLVFKQDFIRTNPGRMSVKQVTRIYVVTGAAMSYGGYGQMFSYAPGTKLFPNILLTSINNEKHIEATI